MLAIFDFDGVIADSMLLHCEVESDAYSKIGIEIAPLDLARRFAGISQREVSRILSKESGKPIPEDFDPEPLKRPVFSDKLKGIPYIAEALDNLRAFSFCIASGSSLATLEHCLPIIGLYDRFAPNIFSSQQVARGKPAPDLFLYAANAMRRRPDQCFVVEDGVAGIKAAKAAGMIAFGFTGGGHCDASTGEILKAHGADAIFTDMRALPSLVGGFFNAPA